MDVTDVAEVQAWVRDLVANKHKDEESKLLAYLQNQIEFILESKPEMLPQILYRLDVDENKANEVLNKPRFDWPADIAKLIFEREKLRLRMWEQYSNKPE